MALSQSILWTTLPNGRVTSKKRLRLTVFVSPRLSPGADEVLKPFQHFLVWPEFSAGLHFELESDALGSLGPLDRVATEDAPDGALWRRMFDADTFVRGHQFTDLQNEPIRSFPAAEVHGYLQEIYGWTAEKHGQEFPSHDEEAGTPLSRLKQELGPLSNVDWRRHVDRALDESIKKTKVLPPAPLRGMGIASPAQYAFLQAAQFYSRPKPSGNLHRERPDPAFEPAPVPKPEFDFHQALTAFGDYPRLLRRLGLAIDFSWPETKSLPPEGRVRVKVLWEKPEQLPAWHVKDQPSWTAYVLTKDDFRARPAATQNAELAAGQLDLSTVGDAKPDPKKAGPYFVAQTDIDGGALKLMNTAGTLVRLSRPDVSNYRTPQTSDLAALRTGGLALYRRARAAATHGQLVRAAKLQAAVKAKSAPELFAEDLLRGYRVDVWDDVSRAWHPLCLRNGEYRFTKNERHRLQLSDEGYVKSASAARGDKGTPPDLYLHERLLAFDGWSLVAPRPGRVLPKDPSDAEPAIPSEQAATEFGLATHFAVPAGTLPRLRYGRAYRLRVRVVDLAGNSVEFADAGDRFATQPIRYRRYEPVPSPVLILRARLTEGESLEHLVIRSDYDRTAAAYAADPEVAGALAAVHDRLRLSPADRKDYVYREFNDRHVAPPKISQLEAELHGRFDEAIGQGKNHARGYLLATREAATFLSLRMVDLNAGKEVPIPGLDIDTVPPAGKARTNLKTLKPGDPLQEGEYVVHREAQLKVPYLPDPFAAGVVFVGLPGVPAGEPYPMRFDGGTWPDPLPFRLRLVERPGTMKDCDQVFSNNGAPVRSADGRELTVFIPKGVTVQVRYSCVLPSQAAAQQMGIWRWLEQRGGLTSGVRKAILAGTHWMFTPWRTLTLTHAVQHPLCLPTIKTFEADRGVGDTHADLRGTWHLSIKSTGKVVVLADWSEPLDDVHQPAWQTLERSGQAAELKMNPLYADNLEVPPPVNPLVPRAKLPLRHEFGDTKHRVVRYRLKGTTRFREYFPVELTQDDEAITRAGPEFAVSIPNSARPAGVQPLYVLPTFRWEETTRPDGITRTRRGNGLRVYLARPWWLSGESERLGVVFKTGTIDPKGPYKPYVTQWGQDPLFESPAPAAGPKQDSFPRAVNVAPSVSLQEIGDGKAVFSVAGHEVEFDPERRLWFSDIEVGAGSSYFPFVRLALARFQPFSLQDCHLSRVVLTDFVQLVPDRTLEVTWLSATTVRVRLFGIGPTATFASRVITQFMDAKSAAQGGVARSRVQDVMSEPLSGTRLVEAFKAGYTAVAQQEGRVKIDLDFAEAKPAAPSAKLGLNEYTVAVEELPEGTSEDFGWKAVEGVSVTQPLPQPKRNVLVDPQVSAKATRTAVSKAVTASAARSISAKSGTGSIASKAGGVRVTDKGTSAGIKPAGIEMGPVIQIAPLWEAEVALPVASAGRPRRLVIREEEVYFRATAGRDESLPLARRLVYVDVVELPRRE